MLQEHLAVGPALAFFAHEVFQWDLYVFEDDFVDLAVALDRDDRIHRDAGCLHVDEQEADAFLAPRDVRAGSCKQENPVGMLAERGPGLGAVQDVVIAREVRARLQRREIRTGARLGVALAPPHVAREDVGQEALLLLLVAEGIDDGADHAEAEGHDRRRVGFGHLGREDVLLHRRPARAAIFDRPVHPGPAALVQPLLEADEVLALHRHALVSFAANVVREFVAKYGADLLAEGKILIA